MGAFSLRLLVFFAVFRWLGHDILKVRPQGFDGGELVAYRRHPLQVAIELVEILQDIFKTLECHLVPSL